MPKEKKNQIRQSHKAKRVIAAMSARGMIKETHEIAGDNTRELEDAEDNER